MHLLQFIVGQNSTEAPDINVMKARLTATKDDRTQTNNLRPPCMSCAFFYRHHINEFVCILRHVKIDYPCASEAQVESQLSHGRLCKRRVGRQALRSGFISGASMHMMIVM